MDTKITQEAESMAGPGSPCSAWLGPRWLECPKCGRVGTVQLERGLLGWCRCWCTGCFRHGMPAGDPDTARLRWDIPVPADTTPEPPLSARQCECGAKRRPGHRRCVSCLLMHEVGP